MIIVCNAGSSILQMKEQDKRSRNIYFRNYSGNQRDLILLKKEPAIQYTTVSLLGNILTKNIPKKGKMRDPVQWVKCLPCKHEGLRPDAQCPHTPSPVSVTLTWEADMDTVRGNDDRQFPKAH